MRIRAATVDVAHAIAVVHVRCWRAAYRGVFPDEFLDGMQVSPRAERWRENLGAATSTSLVADADGDLLGFASFGGSRDDDALRRVHRRHTVGPGRQRPRDPLLRARRLSSDGAIKDDTVAGTAVTEVRYRRDRP